MHIRRLSTAVLVTSLALLLPACGSSAGGGASSDASSAGSSTAEAVIDTFMFSPKTLRVRAGTKVTWTNHDSILHTVTSGRRDYEPGNGGNVTATRKDGMFDMQLDGKGATASFTFTKAGTYHYFCDRHPGMEADIEVS